MVGVIAGGWGVEVECLVAGAFIGSASDSQVQIKLGRHGDLIGCG